MVFTFGINYLVRLLILTITILCVSANVKAGVVRAKGLAPIINGDIVSARKVALEEAKKTAVEQMLGTFIESRTSIENFALASDTVVSSVKGRINNFRIEIDKVTDKIYEIEILANVAKDDLLQETKKTISKFNWQRSPRISIRMISNDKGMGKAFAKQIQQELQKKYKSLGYEVFDNDSKTINKAGFELSGEVFFISNNNEFQGIDIKTNQVSISTNLKRVGSDEVLSVASYNQNVSGGPFNKTSRKLVVNASNSLFNNINDPLLNSWLKESDNDVTLLLKVSGDDLSNASKSIKKLMENKLLGVSSIKLDKLSSNKAEFVVIYRGWPEQFLDELNLVLEKDQSFQMKLIGLMGQTLEFSVQ